MQDQWMREGKGFLLVYSVSDRASFDEIMVFKEKILRAKELDKVPMVLVGNKCDLDPSERQVSKEEGEELGRQRECSFMETSAKAKIKNDECFYECVRVTKKMDEEVLEPVKKKKIDLKQCLIL